MNPGDLRAGTRPADVLLGEVLTMVRRSGAKGITRSRAIGQVRHSSRVGRTKAMDLLAALHEARLIVQRDGVFTGAPPPADEGAALDLAWATFKRMRHGRLERAS